jgi:hypothetical protein
MLDMDEKLMNRSVNDGFSGRPSSLGNEERNVFARHRDLKEPGFGDAKTPDYSDSERPRAF